MPTLPDNPFKDALRRNAYDAARIVVNYTGEKDPASLKKIAEDYTEVVAAKTRNIPPILTREQIIADPNFQALVMKADIKKDAKGEIVGGWGLKDELIHGIPNGFLYSGLATVGYFGYQWWKKRKAAKAGG